MEAVDGAQVVEDHGEAWEVVQRLDCKLDRLHHLQRVMAVVFVVLALVGGNVFELREQLDRIRSNFKDPA